MDNQSRQFEKHFGAKRPALLRYAYSLTRDHEVAQDIVQDAFMRLLDAQQKGKTFELAPYVTRAVRNLCLDHLRAEKRKSNIFATSHDDDLQPQDPISPEQQFAARQQWNLFLNKLNQLPEETRVIIKMNRVDGLTLQHISQQLDIPLTTVHRLLKKGLHECLSAIDQNKLENSGD